MRVERPREGQAASRRASLLSAALLIVAAAAPWSTVGVHAAETLPLHNFDGVLCIRVQLHTDAAEAPAFLALDLGTRAPLLLHSRTAALLGFSGRGRVDVRVDDSSVTLAQLSTVAQELEPLETITRKYAASLGEIPVCGVLGLPAFNDRVVELDIRGHRLALLTADEAAAQTHDDIAAAYAASFSAEGYGYWLTGEAEGESLRIRLATSEFDTRVNVATALRLGHPDGHLEQLLVGDLDLAKYAVLRPSDLSNLPEPLPDVILGTGLLSHMLLHVDLPNHRLTWWPATEPRLPAAERAYYAAQALADADALERLLQEHPDFRLAEEAAEELLMLRSDAPAVERDAVQRALHLYAQSMSVRLRAGALVAAADRYIAAEEANSNALELALLALETAEPFAADDPNAAAIHQINARRGLIALLRSDYATAHRYLLSAAFGLPKDPYVNLWLARLYEVKGQASRAWSRYLESALHDEPPVGAFRGLNRLNNDPAFRATFTMVGAGRLLEGRVPTFHPAGLRDALPASADRRVQLVELFSNCAIAETQAAELAFDALANLMNGSTVWVQYHHQDGLSCAGAQARAEFYGIDQRPTAIFDGTTRVTTGGDDGAAAQVFAEYRAACDRTPKDQIDLQLNGRAELLANNVVAEVAVPPVGLNSDLALHVVLCERSVMALGGNGQALHHWVARAELATGDDWRRTGVCRIEASLARVQEELATHLAGMEASLGARINMKATYIDPEALALVVFIQNVRTREVPIATRIPIARSASAP